MTTRSGIKSAVLLASAVAGLLAVHATGNTAQAADADADKVHCYGINKCKGTGDCSGRGHSCSGQNACAGQGHINLPKDVCLRIKGGHLTPAAGEEG